VKDQDFLAGFGRWPLHKTKYKWCVNQGGRKGIYGFRVLWNKMPNERTRKFLQEICGDFKSTDRFLTAIVLELLVAVIDLNRRVTASWSWRSSLHFHSTGVGRKDVTVSCASLAAEMCKHVDAYGTCKQQEHQEEQATFSHKLHIDAKINYFSIA
jgi:hypothetical protein